MLKLCDLQDDRNLMKTMLSKWEVDEDQGNLQDYFRVSSTAVYPISLDGSVHYLRYVPATERVLDELVGEKDFLESLREVGLVVPSYKKSKEGNYIESIVYNGRIYYGSVLTEVDGDRLDRIVLDDSIAFDLGVTLAKVHDVGLNFEGSRKTHLDQLNWMEEMLRVYDPQLLSFHKKLKEKILAIRKTSENYGLIHYDFEPDNLFSFNGSIGVIDFDDTVYHFLYHDIINALEELDSGLHQSFLEGYESLKVIDENMKAFKDEFVQYSQLHKYCKIKYALDCKIDSKFKWMSDLSRHLENHLINLRQSF